MIKMNLAGVALDAVSRNPIILLKDTVGHRALPIYIGGDQAKVLISAIENQFNPRPFTHDLITSIIANFKGEVTDIVINKLQEDVFYSTIVINHSGTQFQIDARPSDAVIIAVKTGAAIWVTEEVFIAKAIPVDRDAEQQERMAEKAFIAKLKSPADLIKNSNNIQC